MANPKHNETIDEKTQATAGASDDSTPDYSDESSKSVLKSTGIMTMATLLSRLTGLIRTWAMAFALGNTLLTSAYQVAYNMPSMIYELAASGILATAFLPLYLLQKERHGKGEAQRFSSNILSLTVVFLGALALLASFFAPEVIATQTFTVENSETQELAVFFFRIFAVQILLYGLGAVITSILNAERIFIVPSLAPVVNNIIVIVVMFGYVPISAADPTFAMWWLAIGTSLGVLLQFGAQVPVLIKHGFKFTPRIDLKDPMLKEALKVALPTVLYVAGTMVTFSCRNAFSLEAAPNGPSTLNYAWTWYQLPYGVIAVSLSTALLTELSECAAKTDWEGFRGHVAGGLRTTFFLIIPLAAMVGVLSVPLMQLFRAGAFSAEDVQTVASMLGIWTLSLPFYAGYMYMYRVFAAMRKFVQFALVDIGLRVFQIVGYWLLCPDDVLGLAGIPVSDLFFYAAMFIVCSLMVRSKVGEYGNRGIFVMFIKTTIAALVGSAAAYLVAMGVDSLFLLSSVTVSSIVTGLTACICAGGVGLVVSFGLCKVFHIEEFAILGGIGRKFKGLLGR